MLVLSRKLDESIMVGDDVMVTVVDMRRNSDGVMVARLLITAPPHVPVYRKEVYEAIQREGQQ